MLIVFEGIDGVGKSSHAARVSKKYNWEFIDSLHTNTIAASIAQCYLYEDQNNLDYRLIVNLAAIAERYQIILGNTENKNLVMSRYVPSTLAYGSYSDSSFRMYAQLNLLFPVPDLTIYLDCPLEQIVKRLKNKDRDKNEELKRLKEVDYWYKCTKNYLDDLGWKSCVIHTEQPKEVVYKQIDKEIEKVINYEQY